MAQLFQAFRFKIAYCSNDYYCVMIIINIVLTIKVVYDHTRIASYRHLHVGNVGGEYGYWLLEVNECSAAGGFPSNPILSRPAPNTISICL